jgi:methylmalonyl-CoA/ethylmalonyl-CoA epimerase
MFERIDHVGIAVTEIEPAIAQYKEQFNVEFVHRERLDDVDAALVSAGDGRVEFVAPLTEGTALGRFLQSRGPGLHHIAYAVDDIEAALAALRERAVKLIDTVPRAGIRNSRIAFLHPSSCSGVLTEIVEAAH